TVGADLVPGGGAGAAGGAPRRVAHPGLLPRRARGGGDGAPARAVEAAALRGHRDAPRPRVARRRGAGDPSARSARRVAASGTPPFLPVRPTGGASSRLRGGGERERAGEGDGSRPAAWRPGGEDEPRAVVGRR